jgi:hypothetical protein
VTTTERRVATAAARTKKGDSAMRKLIVSTLVSLDGVIESPNDWANFDG